VDLHQGPALSSACLQRWSRKIIFKASVKD